MSTVLVVLLIIILLGGVGFVAPWGNRPAYWGAGYPVGGLLGLLLMIVLILALVGRI